MKKEAENEVLAINDGASKLNIMNAKDERILICFNSESPIKALSSYKSSSAMLWGTGNPVKV